jgi:hypothetical protein
VAADLVSVFDDTPWLDVQPSEEGQTALLRGLGTMERAAFEQACQRLGMPPGAPSVTVWVASPLVSPSASPFASAGSADPVAVSAIGGPTSPHAPAAPLQLELGAAAAAEEVEGVRRFLLQVMNDSSVALALRVEAAKVLLQHSAVQRQPLPD